MKKETKRLEVTDFNGIPQINSGTVDLPNAGQVRVRILGCGLNFADLLMIKGTYQETPSLPFVPGMEICGEIDAIGNDVEGLSVGQRVAAVVNHGGLATFANIDAESCVLVPDTMSDVEAAGFQIAYGTSHLVFTRRAQLAADETVLVLGAAGGVGLTAVEIAKIMGARVIAIARGAEKLEIARAAGADLVIDANSSDILEDLKAAGPIQVVYDAVGGALGQAALRAIAPEGRYILIGFASGELPDLKPNHLLVKNTTVIGFYWGGYKKFAPKALTESLTELFEWHGQGKLRPHISHVFTLDRATEGLELLRSRKATGKVVITP